MKRLILSLLAVLQLLLAPSQAWASPPVPVAALASSAADLEHTDVTHVDLGADVRAQRPGWSVHADASDALRRVSYFTLPLTGAGKGAPGGSSGIAATFTRVNGPADGPTAGPYEAWSVYGTSAISNDTAFTLDRQGYDGSGNTTTYQDTLYVTRQLRQVYPNQASLQADYYAVSDPIYSTDTITGGATNNSTFTSPKSIVNWAMLARSVVSTTLTWEAVAFHRNMRSGRQIAAFVARVSDSDGGGDCATGTASSTSVSGRSTDRNAVIVYTGTLDISGCADGVLTLNGKAYPWIGAAASVIDSADSSVGREFSPRYYLKVASFSRPYAYVTAGGSDANDCADTDPTVADDNPCLTVQGAINKLHTDFGGGTWGIDGAEIRVGDGTYDIDSTSGNKTQKVGCITVTRSPVSTSRAAVVLTSGEDVANMNLGTGGTLTSPVTTGCIRFNDVTLQRTSAYQAFVTGNNTYNLEIQFDDVTYDRSGASNTVIPSNGHLYINGLTCSTAGNQGFGASTGELRLARGLNCDINNAGLETWLVLGSTISRPGSNGLATGTTRAHSGGIFAFNKVLNPYGAGTLMVGTLNSAPVGYAVVQNLFEWISTSAGHSLAISNDSASYGNTHVVVAYNTFAGSRDKGRLNIFYDEGLPALARSSKLLYFGANIAAQVNTKSDVFATDGTRLGNWAFEFGSGTPDNVSLFIDASAGGIGSSFAQDYAGRGSTMSTSDTVAALPYTSFTSWQATTNSGTTAVAGAGSGDYRLKAGNLAIDIVDVSGLSHTLDGVARDTTNDDAGALSKE